MRADESKVNIKRGEVITPPRAVPQRAAAQQSPQAIGRNIREMEKAEQFTQRD